MRPIRYVLILILLLILNLHAEEEVYRRWFAYRESIRQDRSVSRYYTFEDVKDSGSTVKDIKGSGNDLVYSAYRHGDKTVEDLEIIEGRFPGTRAVRLDRGFYRGPSFDIEDKQFSLSCWFRRQGPGGILPASRVEEGAIVSVAGWERGWRIATVYDKFNTLRFCLGQPGGCEKAMSNISIPDNVWHHLAATWDGRDMLIYFNGILVGKKEFAGSYNPVGKEGFLRLGYAGGAAGSVVLDIDELALYNRALSREEAMGLSRSTASPAKNIFSSADRHILSGDYDSARREYEKLKVMTSLEHGREIALFNIAESYRLEKDYTNAHKTFREILSLPGLTAYYRIYGLFRQAETYLQERRYDDARRLYSDIPGIKDALEHHVFKSELYTGDAYRAQRKYKEALKIYSRLLRQQNTSSYPHEEYRLELIDRIEDIGGLTDGQEEKSRREKRAEWVKRPKYGIYVSLQGNDNNPGTKESPFATLKRAQEEVRNIKAEGMPDGGIAVYIRGGRYFLRESIVLDREDSGQPGSPVVYRSYPGEEARLIGGRELTNFRLLDDPEILRRIPEESRGKVWVSDLGQAGINDYGRLVNRGSGASRPAALELFYNTRPMRLARWPNEGWLLVDDVVTPGGDGGSGMYVYQKARFRYQGDRPKRWTEEKDIWTVGYFMRPWDKVHTGVINIDTDKRIVSLAPDIRHHTSSLRYDMPVCKDKPYYFYNLLSELAVPGEFYVDRDAGKLYFYPPGNINGSEIIASTLNAPVIEMRNVSNVVLFGLTVECTRHTAIEIRGGINNIIAGCTIRNTGQNAVIIKEGWKNSVIGCDMYGMGEGGVNLSGGNWENLVPAGHLVENNHIHNFNRFDGGYRPAVRILGVGQRVSHNLISDSPHQALFFDYNDHVIEFNEIYDVVHEAKDAGAIYLYGEPRYLMNRGNILRYNFIHNITEHSSVVPYLNPGINSIYIDALNAGPTMVGNILLRCTGTAVFNHGAYSRIENSIFADNRLSINQGDRSRILNRSLSRKRWEDNILARVRHNQPPWASRYPQLRNMAKDENPGLPRNVVNERNINIGGEFVREYPSFLAEAEVVESYVKRNNMDGYDPLFIDPDNLDFTIRPGSPAYGITGCEPLPFEKIGLYEDFLRASWPVERPVAGKYYKQEKLESLPSSPVSFGPLPFAGKPLICEVKRRTGPVKIDGRLEKSEWAGLERDKAIVIEDIIYPKPENGEKGDRSYAWLAYDDEYLYMAVENTPNPFKPGMDARQKKLASVLNEISIEGMHDENTWWWQRNIDTGPVYIFTGRPDGRFEVSNIFMMPQKTLDYLRDATEYKAVMIDEEDYHWTAEWKIPLAALNINPGKQDAVRFNIGAAKRGGWLAWVPTGGSVWRLDNGGILKFAE